MKIPTYDVSSLVTPEVVTTALLILGVAVFRMLVPRMIRRGVDILSEDQRRSLWRVKNSATTILIIGLLVIWLPELRNFAISITAFAVAIIIATKELILCFSGAFLKASSSSFSVGDWVQIGSTRGEVVDQTLLTVTLQEIHPDGVSYEYTGRTVTIPNSVFLTTPIRNENFARSCVYHPFSILIPDDINAFEVEQAVVAAVQAEAAASRKIVERYNAMVERKTGVDLPGIDPVSRFTTTAEGKNKVDRDRFRPDTESRGYRAKGHEMRP